MGRMKKEDGDDKIIAAIVFTSMVAFVIVQILS
jgi:hypothetical protein